MAQQFEHEDIATVPRGWKVRSIKHPDGTVVRLAFPPGPRRKGAGRLVSILHPTGNPYGGLFPEEETQREYVLPRSAGEADAQLLADQFAREHPSAMVYGFADPNRAGQWVIRIDEGETANPKRSKTREQVEKAQAKAVKFLRDVAKDDDKADEIEDMSVEDYAEKKKWTLSNPGIAAGWNQASERYRLLVLQDARIPSPEQYASKYWNDLPAEVRAKLSGRPIKNKFDTPRERAAYAAGLSQGQSDLSAAAERLRQRKATRIERMMRSGLGRANPRNLAADGDIEAAAERFREFHGEDPRHVTDVHEAEIARDTYSGLGKLHQLKIAQNGKRFTLDFQDCGVVLARGAEGEQLYIVGGDQDCDAILNGQGQGKDFVNVGVIERVSYETRKSFDKFKDSIYEHKFGDEGGEKPWLLYNRLSKRLFIVDGDYTIDSPGIIN